VINNFTSFWFLTSFYNIKTGFSADRKPRFNLLYKKVETKKDFSWTGGLLLPLNPLCLPSTELLFNFITSIPDLKN